ncbi:MAG: nickel pincer cofactor biosynthesis protein LarC [Cyanobacteriota bacterium]|nr:nickel pincer cofactor biosynthesis protein LarC [Cyanobacteriota bacterium]
MTLALVDCPTGLAGDMLLAAVLDLGLSPEVVHRPLAQLGLAGRYRLDLEEATSAGLRGCRLRVTPLETDPPHRRWLELRELIAHAPWNPDLRDRVLAVFSLLAEAEAAVHGLDAEQVQFHEVGAIDALVDVVGVCAGLQALEVTRLVCTVPPAGHGVVRAAHGPLPLPAPAVLEIARRRAIPLAGSGGFPAGELTTPTGLALMGCWAEGFGAPPTLVPRAVGVGLGQRTLDRPNLLRLVLAEAGEAVPTGVEAVRALVVQQAQIDDATPEDLAHLVEQLRQAGAREVFSQPVAMKKGRLGTLVTALVEPALAPDLRQLWWQHGSSLGLRERLEQRWELPRRMEQLTTALGPVRFKRRWRPDGREALKPEHDDLVALARRHNLSVAEVRDQVLQALAAQP